MMVAQRQWEKHASRIACKLNTAWCLESLSGPLILFSLIATCAVLILRQQHPALLWWQPALASLLGLLMLTLATIWFTRKKFASIEQVFIRIEAAMHLRSCLSAARAGVCSWPVCPEEVHAGLRWNWLRSLYAPLVALALLAAAIFIPIATSMIPGSAPDQPQSWLATETELQQLENHNTVDQEYIEQVRKKIDELRANDPQEWFSHSSMEATDTIRNNHRKEAKKLERDLTTAAKAIGGLEKSQSLTEGERARLANEFDQALDGMKNGTMKPNAGLLNQLKGLDPEQLQKQLSPQQMQQLMDSLEKNSTQLNQALGGENGDQWQDGLNADGSHPNDQQGKGKGDGDGDEEGEGEGEQEGNGKGQVARGPGDDPDVFGEKSAELSSGALEGLQAQDLSQSRPGDLLELKDGEHDVDQSATPLRNGGSTDATGKGGDRVWRDSLNPEEQKALKKFFE